MSILKLEKTRHGNGLPDKKFRFGLFFDMASFLIDFMIRSEKLTMSLQNGDEVEPALRLLSLPEW